MERKQWWYLLFWPAFGLRYLLLEAYQPVNGFHPVSCGLDEKIPFLEGFLIPYFLWYVCLIGMHLWLCFHEEETFRRYTRFLLVSMTISTTVFLLWPSCQNLRPEVFPRDNVLTRGVAQLYRLDTSTNVLPSEHVIGSVGFFLAAVYSQTWRTPGRLLLTGLAALLTAGATVFLKQHSILDVVAALPVCMTGWLCSFFWQPHSIGASQMLGTETDIHFRYG